MLAEDAVVSNTSTVWTNTTACPHSPNATQIPKVPKPKEYVGTKPDRKSDLVFKTLVSEVSKQAL
jgi:hypothetical protein